MGYSVLQHRPGDQRELCPPVSIAFHPWTGELRGENISIGIRRRRQ